MVPREYNCSSVLAVTKQTHAVKTGRPSPSTSTSSRVTSHKRLKHSSLLATASVASASYVEEREEMEMD